MTDLLFARTDRELAESALFDEAKHPRGRGGKWAETLGHVKALGHMATHKTEQGYSIQNRSHGKSYRTTAPNGSRQEFHDPEAAIEASGIHRGSVTTKVGPDAGLHRPASDLEEKAKAAQMRDLVKAPPRRAEPKGTSLHALSAGDEFFWQGARYRHAGQNPHGADRVNATKLHGGETHVLPADTPVDVESKEETRSAGLLSAQRVAQDRHRAIHNREVGKDEAAVGALSSGYVAGKGASSGDLVELTANFKKMHGRMPTPAELSKIKKRAVRESALPFMGARKTPKYSTHFGDIFDEARHPRDRHGEFAAVLGKLTANHEAVLPHGVSVRKSMLGGFRVSGPGDQSRHSFDPEVASRAAHEMSSNAARRLGQSHVIHPAMQRHGDPRGYTAALDGQPQVGDRVDAHLENIGTVSGMRVVGSHPGYEITVRHPTLGDHKIPANWARVTSTARQESLLSPQEPKSKGHVAFIGKDEFFHTPNGDLARAPRSAPLTVEGYRPGRFEAPAHMSDQFLAFARDAEARRAFVSDAQSPEVKAGQLLDRRSSARAAVTGAPSRNQKAQAMVDSGLADNLMDARAQLADMGEGGARRGASSTADFGGRAMAGLSREQRLGVADRWQEAGARAAGGPVNVLSMLAAPAPASESSLLGMSPTQKRLSQLRDVVASKQHKTIDGHLVDMQTANLLLQVHDALSPERQAKFGSVPIDKLAQFAYSRTK